MSDSRPDKTVEVPRWGLSDSTFALLGAAILIFSAAIWSDHGPNVEKTDFSLTYVGAKIIHDGHGDQLYDEAFQKELRNSLFLHPVPLFFEHPPFEAILLSPLANFPFRKAYLWWCSTNAAIWIALIFFLRKYLPWPKEGLGYVALWLMFAPLWVSLYQGQTSIIVLAAFSLAYVFLRAKREWAAGLALGIGLFKFQFIVPFLLIFLIRRRWRLVAGTSLISLALIVVSLLGVGWAGLLGYMRFLAVIGANQQNVSYGSGVDMPTIHGLVFAIFGRSVGTTTLNSLVILFSVVLIIWIAIRWNLEQPIDFMFSAVVAGSLACGSHMFTHDFSPVIVPMFLVGSNVWSKNGDTPKNSWQEIATKILLVLLWTFPIYFLCVKWHCLYLMGPVLLLFVAAAIHGARNRRPNKPIVLPQGTDAVRV